MKFIYIFHPAIPNRHDFPSREGILGLAAKAQMFNCASRVKREQERNPDVLVVHAYPNGVS